METLFAIRRLIARVGESDAMGWWQSYALGPTGAYVVPRIFPRTTTLSAAHLSILAARRRQDGSVPSQPHVHLFNLGELMEGRFERWLIERKQQRWLPEGDGIELLTSLEEALRRLGIRSPKALPSNSAAAVEIGTIESDALAEDAGIHDVAQTLAGAYVGSDRGKLRVPYLRLKR